MHGFIRSAALEESIESEGRFFVHGLQLRKKAELTFTIHSDTRVVSNFGRLEQASIILYLINSF